MIVGFRYRLTSQYFWKANQLLNDVKGNIFFVLGFSLQRWDDDAEGMGKGWGGGGGHRRAARTWKKARKNFATLTM